jgi:hypothetical protein
LEAEDGQSPLHGIQSVRDDRASSRHAQSAAANSQHRCFIAEAANTWQQNEKGLAT